MKDHFLLFVLFFLPLSSFAQHARPESPPEEVKSSRCESEIKKHSELGAMATFVCQRLGPKDKDYSDSHAFKEKTEDYKKCIDRAAEIASQPAMTRAKLIVNIMNDSFGTGRQLLEMLDMSSRERKAAAPCYEGDPGKVDFPECVKRKLSTM